MAPSLWQILIVFALIFLLFGAGRLPKIMEDLGKGIKNFKKGLSEDDAPKQIDSDTSVHRSNDHTKVE